MASFRSRHNSFLSFYIYYSYVSVSGKAKHIRESRNTSSLESGTFDRYFNPIRPGERGGGAESARADFNLREFPCYSSNTYEILPLFLKLIGE